MCDFNGAVRHLTSVPAEHFGALRQRLLDAERSDPEFWSTHDAVKPNNFGVFKNRVQHIVFGFPASLDSHATAKRFEVWNSWRPTLQPVIDGVVGAYNYPTGQVNRVMFARLLPGATIALHIDDDPSSIIPHKIHVPLITNSEVEWWQEDGVYRLDEGVAYEVNNRRLHGGINRGTAARIHLIFDYFAKESCS